MRKTFTQWSVLGSLLVGISVTAAEDLKGELQKGLFEEEGNHNTAAAIESYRRVASQFDKDRKLAATAIFRLGECYRKEGKTNEASVYYGRILRDFSDQTNLVKAVREVATVTRLAVVGTGEETRGVVVRDGAIASAELEELKKLPREKLRVAVQRILQSPVYDSLLAKELAVERELEVKRGSYGSDHPEVKRSEAERKILERQVNDQIEVAFTELAARAVGARNPGSGIRTGARREEQTTSEEAEEIKRITVLIRNSPDLINAEQGGQTPLGKAAQRGQLEVAKFLLEHGANVNAMVAGFPTLYWAAAGGHRAVVELLLANKADVNATGVDGVAALHPAAERGFLSVCKVLLDHGADPNIISNREGTPLHIVSLKDRVEIAKLLFERKADPKAVWNGRNALHLAASRGAYRVAELLVTNGVSPNIRDTQDRTALHHACGATDKGDLNIVRLLIAHHADLDPVDTDGFTPLQIAASKGPSAMLAVLLEAGANPNRHNDRSGGVGHGNSKQFVTYPGETPLHSAVRRIDVDSVQCLVTNKADVNVQDSSGGTPLYRAVETRSREIVERLLTAGVDLNIADPRGYTPLHLAAQNQLKEIVELLLASKANPNALTKDGLTPRDLAEGKGGSVGGVPFGGMSPELAKRYGLRGVVPEIADKNQISELLTKAGTKDLQRLSRIFLKTGPSTLPPTEVFIRDTNKLNRFTLFEVVAPFILPWSDFKKARISRLDPSTGQTNEIPVDLEAALNDDTSCDGNIWLEWGDIVSIPEADHRVGEGWPGLSKQHFATLRRCTARHVTLRVHGESRNFILVSHIGGRNETVAGEDTIEGCYLSEFLGRPKLLRASSDLSRVKVTRKGSEKQPGFEKVFDLRSPQHPNILWLRDGDVIEIPDKE